MRDEELRQSSNIEDVRGSGGGGFRGGGGPRLPMRGPNPTSRCLVCFSISWRLHLVD